MAVVRRSTPNALHFCHGLDGIGSARVLRALSRSLPPMDGAPIRMERSPGLSDRHGPVHAGSFLRERRIAFDCTRAEFPRILVHELFHFVWLRLGNPVRQSWERLLRSEFRQRVRGELGWSAEWRKDSLRPADIARRTRAWRLYCCESFCDTAAWLYAPLTTHPEFTLAGNPRRARREWFFVTIGTRQLSI